MLFSVQVAYPAPPRAPSRGGWGEMVDGVRYIVANPTLLWVLAASFITSLLAMPYLLLLPGFVREVFGGDGVELGLLISVGGAGALVGALTLASLPSKRRGMLLLGSSLLIGVALLGFSASPSIWLAAGFMVFIGVGSAGRQALGNVLLQTHTDDEYRGRVMSVFMTQFSVMSMGAFVVGVAAEWLGVRWALGSMAAMLVVVSTGFLLLVPRLRRLD
jgi:MFS family permease